jgi:hypothetical protein
MKKVWKEFGYGGDLFYPYGVIVTRKSVMEMRANVGNVGRELQSSSLGRVGCKFIFPGSKID